MERHYAIDLAESHQLFPTIISVVRDAHNDYLRTTPIDMRSRIDSSARAHTIHRHIMFHMLTRLGESGLVRLKEYRRLKYLFVQGEPLSMAWRVKKVERVGLRSRTYPTMQQNRLLEEGKLLFDDAYPHHLIVGYTESGDDANPEIERIVLTRELHRGIDWWHLLWRADTQASPIETGYDQPVLPQYQIKLKKPAAKRAEKPTKQKDRKQGTDANG
jgi:hypothetical protein